MFIYMLIACELGLLYTVFWYIYLREPRRAARIKYNTWGQYHAGDTMGGEADVAYFFDYWNQHSETQDRQSRPVDFRPEAVPIYAYLPQDQYAGEVDWTPTQTKCGCCTPARAENVKPFMVPLPEEMIFDLNSNRYRPMIKPKSAGWWWKWMSLWEEVDDKLSVLNVKP